MRQQQSLLINYLNKPSSGEQVHHPSHAHFQQTFAFSSSLQTSFVKNKKKCKNFLTPILRKQRVIRSSARFRVFSPRAFLSLGVGGGEGKARIREYVNYSTSAVATFQPPAAHAPGFLGERGRAIAAAETFWCITTIIGWLLGACRVVR